MITVTHCIKDEQINVVAMTEGVSWKGQFHQTILCKRLPEDVYYILVPKVYSRSQFKKSIVGKGFQRYINDEYGRPDLIGFRNANVAYSVKSYWLVNNSVDLWREICGELFPLWDPEEGPFSHVATYNSNIVLFRVYETEDSVEKYVENPNVRTPKLINPSGVKITIGKPVIDNTEFLRQQQILENILKKHGC